jgi:dihydroflavonol-4-reductase
VRAFVTGGTGFVGGHLVRKLRERGDDVVALVRTPSKAGQIRELGCEIVEGDLSDDEAIRKGVVGCDAVYHVAAAYEVGVPKSRRPELFEANVRGTERVIDAAVDAGVQRIVYVSTVGYFGDTHGETVDETYVRPKDKPPMSVYEETKVEAHELAQQRIAQGAPVIIVQPGGIYGPNDPSVIGTLVGMIQRFGLPFLVFPDAGFNLVYVEDVADGIILAHDKGKVGESYVLGGEIVTMRDALERICRAAGKRVPKRALPGGLMKLSIPFGRVTHRLMGLGPNMRELLANANATFFASDAKARRELGYAPRDLDAGITQTLAAS